VQKYKYGNYFEGENIIIITTVRLFGKKIANFPFKCQTAHTQNAVTNQRMLARGKQSESSLELSLRNAAVRKCPREPCEDVYKLVQFLVQNHPSS